MAPFVPAEIDLFTIPHSRMKELVNTYTQKVKCVDFRDCHEAFNLLQELQSTLYEFKSHEYIENLFIMDQLKNRLKQRHIFNSAVCDCHNDNRLAEMLNLVRHGKHLPECSIGERLNFGEELQKLFSEFVQQFLPHMKEEEEIFQPLMVEHFEYDELRALKEVVIEQHELIRDPLHQEKAALDLPETNSAVKDFRDIDSDVWSLVDLYRESKSDLCEEEEKDSYCEQAPRYESVPFSHKCKSPDPSKEAHNDFSQASHNFLATPDRTRASFNVPSEILIKIFSYLTPPDRGRCAQVCSQWNGLVYATPLWKEIYPIQWSKGIWTWSNVKLGYMMEDELTKKGNGASGSWKYDEDADIDESEDIDVEDCLTQQYLFEKVISQLLPKIGNKVEKIVLDAGTGITSRQIRQCLTLCPNVISLSAAYTKFDYCTLKGLRSQHSLRQLRHLDLQGCVNVNDECLYLLSECLRPTRYSKRMCPIRACMNTYQYQSSISVGDETLCHYCPFSSPSSSVCDVNLFSGPNSSNPGSLFPDHLSYISNYIEIEELLKSSSKQTSVGLEAINISGCYHVTEEGLSCLLNRGLLQNLSYLNLSSCFNVSGAVLDRIVSQCPNLKPENIFYCNIISNGPYPSLANGCDSMYHPIKFCCQNRYVS